MKQVTNQTIASWIVSIFGAAVVSGAILYGMVTGEERYRRHVEEVKQRRQNEIDAVIRGIRDEIEAGKLNDANVNAENLGKVNLTPEQTCRRFLLLGDIAFLRYRENLETDLREYYSEMCDRYYKRALSLTKDHEEIKAIERRRVSIYMDEAERLEQTGGKANPYWELVLRTILDTRSFLLSPEERWSLNIAKARCLLALRRFSESLSVLSQIADESDVESVRTEALRRKADILFDLSVNPEDRAAYAAERDGTAPSPEALRTDAERLYGKIIDESDLLNPQRAYAQLGLLRILSLSGAREAAYERVNQMTESQIPKRIKSEAFILLAKMMESQNRIGESITILESARLNYPAPETDGEIVSLLYKWYWRLGEFGKLTHLARRTAELPGNESFIRTLTSDLAFGRDSLLDQIARASGARQNLRIIGESLGIVQVRNKPLWAEIRNASHFIRAKIFYLTSQFTRANQELESCLNTENQNAELREEIMYLDVMCSLRMRRSPVQVIVRALSYLKTFPQGPHYQSVLFTLLAQYYQTELFENALEIAKKIYVDEIVRAGNEAVDPLVRDDWLETVAKIGQCYEKLGFIDTANRIIRAYSRQIADKPYAPEVFLDWSQVAVAKGQIREAIRRLDVVLPKTRDLRERLNLEVARFLLYLRDEPQNPFGGFDALIDKIDSYDGMTAKEKTIMKEPLYQGILDYAVENAPERCPSILAAARESLPESPWIDYWRLRYLSSLFNAGKSLDDLDREHRKAVDTGLFTDATPSVAALVQRQMKMLDNLRSIEQSTRQLREERGL